MEIFRYVLSLFDLRYNTNFVKNFEFNNFFTKNYSLTVHIFYNYQNHPAFQLCKRKSVLCQSIFITSL